MTIHLPEDLERSVLAQVETGQFRSADDLVAHAVRSHLQQSKASQDDPGLGSIGALREDAELIDEIVADAYRRRREETWREVDL